MTDNVIRHRGVVADTDQAYVRVKIRRSSSCSQCAAQKHCTETAGEQRLIEVPHKHPDTYRRGQEVWVVASSSMGGRALFFGIGMPFLIVVASLVLFLKGLAWGELPAALCSLALLAVYYLVLSFNKERMRRQFLFRIEPVEHGSERITN